MSQAATSQLFTLTVVALFVGFAVVRRMRPQPVRPGRLIVGGVAIVLVIGASLVGAGGSIVGDPLALVLIPVFAAAGAALGYFLVRTMTFWSDPATGALWMKGGALFALILVATIAVRFGVRTVVYGSPFGSARMLRRTSDVPASIVLARDRRKPYCHRPPFSTWPAGPIRSIAVSCIRWFSSE